MKSNYGVKSFEKILKVLECFSTVDRDLSVSEIVERTDLPRSTAHRIILSLREIGFLDQDKTRNNYRLGFRLFEFGNTVLVNMDLPGVAHPVVEMLGQTTGESVHLCVFDGWRMAYVDRRAGGRTGPHNSTITMEVSPCHCTGVGKAALAHQPPNIVERIIRLGLNAYTRNTITEPDALRRELALIRERGFSIDAGEIELNVRCVAAPIRNYGGNVFASISVSGSDRRMPEDRLLALAPQVMEHARLISARLGYQPAEEAAQ